MANDGQWPRLDYAYILLNKEVSDKVFDAPFPSCVLECAMNVTRHLIDVKYSFKMPEKNCLPKNDNFFGYLSSLLKHFLSILMPNKLFMHIKFIESFTKNKTKVFEIRTLAHTHPNIYPKHSPAHIIITHTLSSARGLSFEKRTKLLS